ncbi:MAG: hypothetical protein KDB14_07545 [Planctomycetales bacterium]|nr:hypothetical protein [Planctomycetales bacterium]
MLIFIALVGLYLALWRSTTRQAKTLESQAIQLYAPCPFIITGKEPILGDPFVPSPTDYRRIWYLWLPPWKVFKLGDHDRSNAGDWVLEQKERIRDPEVSGIVTGQPDVALLTELSSKTRR